MNIQDIVRLVEAAILVAGVLGVIYAVFKSQTTKETIRQQQDLITTQKERLDLLEKQHIENAKAIGELQGQVNAYKKIPLEKIATSIENIAESNKQILEILTERA